LSLRHLKLCGFFQCLLTFNGDFSLRRWRQACVFPALAAFAFARCGPSVCGAASPFSPAIGIPRLSSPACNRLIYPQNRYQSAAFLPRGRHRHAKLGFLISGFASASLSTSASLRQGGAPVPALPGSATARCRQFGLWLTCRTGFRAILRQDLVVVPWCLKHAWIALVAKPRRCLMRRPPPPEHPRQWVKNLLMDAPSRHAQRHMAR